MGRFFTCVAAIAWVGGIVAIVASASGGADKSATPTSSEATPQAGVPADQIAASVKAARDGDERIQQALAKKITLSMENVTWEELAETVSKFIGAPVVVDRINLGPTGPSEDRFDAHYEEVPLQTALAWLFDSRDAAWTIDNETLIFTSIAGLQKHMRFQIYDIAPLLKLGCNDIVDNIENLTTGMWESVAGEGGTVNEYDRTLSVVNHARAQQEVQQLLDAFAASFGTNASDATAIFGIDSLDAKVNAALKQKISVDYRTMPFESFVVELERQLHVPVHVDRALQKSAKNTGSSIAEHSPITVQIKDATAESMLRTILQPLSLRAEVDHGRLIITTPKSAKDRLVTLVYNVKDITDAEYQGDDLIDTIVNSIAGPWESVEGDGAPDPTLPAPGRLAIRQNWTSHRQIALLLADIRKKVVSPKMKEKAAEPPVDPKAVTTVFYDDIYSSRYAFGQQLIPAITNFVAPETWQLSGKGGIGVIQQVGRAIVIRQTNEVHAQIRDFVRQAREHTERGWRGGMGFGGGGAGGGKK